MAGTSPDQVSPPQDFESVARRRKCDQDKERFEAKLLWIAQLKPAGPSEST